jgi:hypothetical protein
MLIIRNAQMAIFRDADHERFVAEAIDRVSLHHPHEYASMGETACRALVQEVIGRCRGWGIKLEGDILRVLSLRVELGEKFEPAVETAAAREVLQDASLHGSSKAVILEITIAGAGR